jgi:hypothetical protein
MRRAAVILIALLAVGPVRTRADVVSDYLQELIGQEFSSGDTLTASYDLGKTQVSATKVVVKLEGTFETGLAYDADGFRQNLGGEIWVAMAAWSKPTPYMGSSGPFSFDLELYNGGEYSLAGQGDVEVGLSVGPIPLSWTVVRWPSARLSNARLTVTYVPGPEPDLYDAGESYRSFSPQKTEAGQPFQIHCDVQNGGQADAGSFTVDFYASADAIITAADHYIGAVDIAGLVKGARRDCDWSGTFPVGLSCGSYYVGWIIDADHEVDESSETNNTAYKGGYVLTVEGDCVPDLRADDEQFQRFWPTAIEKGEQFNINCQVENAGDGQADPFTVRFFVSSDTDITGEDDDLLLGEERFSAIPADGYDECYWDGIFPASIPSGSYYVAWIIDFYDEVDESNEDNNAGYKEAYKLTVMGEDPVATPTFSPPGGQYDTPIDVQISCATPGATIYYTTNGSTPTRSDPIYTSAIHISSTTTLKAKAWKTGLNPSAVRSATYTFPVRTVTAPTFSPPGGRYWAAVDVSITCATSGATIRYTTDGSTPTEGDHVYISPIRIDSTTTFRAKAWRTGWKPSAATLEKYTITPGRALSMSTQTRLARTTVQAGSMPSITCRMLWSLPPAGARSAWQKASTSPTKELQFNSRIGELRSD